MFQDAITLYGFSSLASETHVFAITEGQRNCPKVALSLLDVGPERLRKLVDGDATALAKASA